MVDPSIVHLEKTAKLILGDDFYELARFFLDIYHRCLSLEQEGTAVIAAFITRRCHVLSQIFYAIFERYQDTPPAQMPEYLGRDFSFADYRRVADRYYTTDINLACLGELLARYYDENQVLPHMLIVDELLLHGRTLNSVLKNLEHSILSSISFPYKAPENSNPKNQPFYLYIQRIQKQSMTGSAQSQFLSSLELRVFVQNDDPLLLLPQYQRQLWAQSIRTPIQTRELSKQFSLLVSVSTVNNNSYSWSIHSSNRPKPVDISDINIEKVNTAHSSIRQATFLWAYPNKQRPLALFTFRLKHSYLAPEEGNNKWLGVPFVLTGRIPTKSLYAFYRQLCLDMPKLLLPFFHRYLDTRQSGKAYWRRLLEINDLILCGLFTKKLFGNGITAQDLDLNMLARNFTDFTSLLSRKESSPPNVQNELEMLWSFLLEQPAERLNEYLKVLLQNAEPIWDLPHLSDTFRPVPPSVTLELQQTLDLNVARLGYETEANAYRRYRKISALEDRQPFWGLCFHLEDVLAPLLDSCHNDLGRVYTLMALLVQQMDLGIIGISPIRSVLNARNELTEPVSSLELRAGEQTMVIKPALYQAYIPVLIESKKRFGENWDDVEAEIQRFVLHLSQAGKNVGPSLAQDLIQFLYDLDYAGQRPEDWHFPMVDSVPKWEFDPSLSPPDSRGTALLKALAEQQELLQIYNRI